ncbi:MAG: prepilin-type N-terminal cleavage/methylation domain-containing protein [bacterium]
MKVCFLKKMGFTLIEMLVVIIIIGVVLGITIIKINSYFAMIRLKTATQDFIQDLQWAQERAKSGTRTTVIFGTITPPLAYTGTYTITEGETILENPIWLSDTERKRDMSKFHLLTNIPIATATLSFATLTGFVSYEVIGSLTFRNKSRFVTVSRLGKIEERK